jgi:hypothetical protein
MGTKRDWKNEAMNKGMIDYINELKNESVSKRIFFFYGSTALYGPGPPHFVEVSWSHTFETHHSR